MNDNKTIEISIEEYHQLLDDSLFLNCLRNAGVDNCNGYDYAIDAYNDCQEVE